MIGVVAVGIVIVGAIILAAMRDPDPERAMATLLASHEFRFPEDFVSKVTNENVFPARERQLRRQVIKNYEKD